MTCRRVEFKENRKGRRFVHGNRKDLCVVEVEMPQDLPDRWLQTVADLVEVIPYASEAASHSASTASASSSSRDWERTNNSGVMYFIVFSCLSACRPQKTNALQWRPTPGESGV